MPAEDPSALSTALMGCYGIGISRIIGAVAEICRDKDGLQWPEALAPWTCVIIQSQDVASEGEELYDSITPILGSDNVILDDRQESIGFKIHDAKRIGYPYIVICGKDSKTSNLFEVIKRRTGETDKVERSKLLPLFQELNSK
jgi:prolyl-tRNA synthetase